MMNFYLARVTQKNLVDLHKCYLTKNCRSTINEKTDSQRKNPLLVRRPTAKERKTKDRK